MTDGLANDFTAATEDEWLALVARALGDAPLAKLTGKTHHGVAIKPLYRAPDAAGISDATGWPGAAPFVRGSRAVADPYLPWDIRQRVDHPDPTTANRIALETLEGGASSVEFTIDPSGENGVITTTIADFETLLKGIRTDLATVAIDIVGDPPDSGEAVSAYLAAAMERPDASAPPKVCFNVDPVSRLLQAGVLRGGASHALQRAAAFANRAREAIPCSDVMRADASAVFEAGGTEVQELALLIATGAEYVRARLKQGSNPAQAVSGIVFRLAVSPDMPVEIAKIRAARRLWSRVAEAFGASDPACAMRIHAVTARRMLTVRDPWVNILRNTAACFAAGVAGADIITVRPFTDAMGRPAPLARRLARNTQIIAQEESFLGRVIDPAGGSWALERLSEDLAQAAWTLFQEIEREGGALAALASGSFQAGVAHARAARLKQAATRSAPITGVSDFPDLDLPEPALDSIDVPALRARLAPSRGSLKDAVDDPADLLADPLFPIRLAEAFERLRDHADARSDAGRRTRVFLAALGPLSEHSARIEFARNLFAAGGVRAVSASVTAADALDAFTRSGCKIACICGSDARYAVEAQAVAAALSDAGALRVYLAGRPGPNEAELRDAGVGEFIHIGVDAVAMLERAHAVIGLS